jgi:tryptophan 7-halogenase
MIRNVLVLGGGSAGFLAAITLKHRLPHLRVTVLRSKDIGIIGVGEGTTIPVLQHVHGYLGLDMADFHRIAQPTWKLGVRFLWGKRPYFDYALTTQLDIHYQGMTKMVGYYIDNRLDFGFASHLMSHNTVFPRRPDGTPQITRDPAYHIENEYFVNFLELHAARMGIDIVDGTVIDIKQNDHGIAGLVLESSQVMQADLYVDSSGFKTLLMGKTLGEPFVSFKNTLFCDRAVVGGWDRTDEPIRPYTTSETMDSGWCWQIDHENRINRGYVYSSSFISDEVADREFREKNPKVERTRIVRFRSGRHQRTWVKNVVAIGNAAGFVEPLESTSLGIICLDSAGLAEVLFDCDLEPRATQVAQFNRRSSILWDITREFLGIHYKFNDRLQTPFWKACQADTDLCGAAEFVEFYRENGPSTLWRNLMMSGNPFGYEGYLSMMLGFDVPYRKTFDRPDHELRIFNHIYDRFDTAARNGVGVKEALWYIRQPGWQWPTNLYPPSHLYIGQN